MGKTPGNPHATGRPPLFDKKQQATFLEMFEATTNFYNSAEAAGVHPQTVRQRLDPDHSQYDEGFAQAYEIAYGKYREVLHNEIYRRAVEGVDEPIIGGRNRNEVVTHVKRYSDNLITMLARRHIPEFKESKNLNVDARNTVGGNISVTHDVDLRKLTKNKRELLRQLLESDELEKDDDEA